MKTKDLVGLAISLGVLFASAWVVSRGWKRGQRNNSYSGAGGRTRSATRPTGWVWVDMGGGKWRRYWKD